MQRKLTSINFISGNEHFLKNIKNQILSTIRTKKVLDYIYKTITRHYSERNPSSKKSHYCSGSQTVHRDAPVGRFNFPRACCCCCCCLPDPFRGMGAWRKTMEPHKPGNSPGSGPEVIKRQRVAKE